MFSKTSKIRIEQELSSIDSLPRSKYWELTVKRHSPNIWLNIAIIPTLYHIICIFVYIMYPLQFSYT